jgi:LPXTG-motif cell wall-anchored protein
MSGVLDDAELVTAPTTSDPALSVQQAADSYQVTGTLAPDQSVTVSYTVKVYEWAQQGDHLLGNFVTVTGEEPPTSCVEESRLCTEHPIQPPVPSSGGDGDLAVTGGAAPIWAAALAAGLLAGGALLMITRRRNAARSEQ